MDKKIELIIKLESIAMGEDRWKALEYFQKHSRNTKSEIVIGGLLSRGIEVAIDDMNEALKAKDSVSSVQEKFNVSDEDIKRVDKILDEKGNLNDLFDIKV